MVGCETSLASGAIDLVCLARTGDLVLVEFKTGPQNPDFRHVLAQLLDYGSDLRRSTVEDFDRGVVQRYLRSGHADEKARHAGSLDELLALTPWELSAEDVEAIRLGLQDVLSTGDFTFVVAAQRFTAGIATTLDYFNTTARYGRYFLVEVIQLEGNELTAHAAQVVAAPPRVSASGGAAEKANEADFLASFPGEAVREAMRDILTSAQQLGLEPHWSTLSLAGAAIPTASRKRR